MIKETIDKKECFQNTAFQREKQCTANLSLIRNWPQLLLKINANENTPLHSLTQNIKPT